MRCFSLLTTISVFLAAAAGCTRAKPPWVPAPAADAPGSLLLSIEDGATRRPTPARVELLDANGRPYFADDAVPAGGD